jgi:uncharacterized membrane protein YozB (DUF420 family)
MEKINFRVRGFITISIGLVVLVIGIVAFYAKLIDLHQMFEISAFSFPFFFIGYLLLRADSRRRKGQPPFSF